MNNDLANTSDDLSSSDITNSFYGTVKSLTLVTDNNVNVLEINLKA